MSDLTLRANIKAVLEAIPGTGRVFDFEHDLADETFVEDFKNDSGKHFGWDIARTSVRVEKVAQRYRVTHSYELRAFYGVGNLGESSRSFHALLDAIVTRLAGIKIEGSDHKSTPQVPMMRTLTIHSLRCHYAEVQIDVSELLPEPEEESTDLLEVGLNYYLKPGDDEADATDLVTLEGGTT
jgi:hypothetical protein